jgi:transcriptional regulator with PAS, ATPase and Fis domain
MRQPLETAKRASARDSKVLITGETGVGKCARPTIPHLVTARVASVRCRQLRRARRNAPRNRSCSVRVKGSLAGAYGDKRGKLEQANGGTIFLHEVGEMTPRIQALLLSFLESGEVHPVGSDNLHRRVDARVVAATNRDLDRTTAVGTLREDLLYRIRVVHLHVPPLRERVEDMGRC